MSHEIVPASPIHDNEFYDAVPALPSSSGHEAEADAEAVDGGIPITRSLTYHTHVAEAVGGGIPITRSLTYHTHVPGPFESERLPTQLASGIQKFLRVANLVESQEPRIAYLCRFHAFEIAHNMDRNSTGRGVRQFKYALLQRLPRDQEATLSKRKERSDIRELRRVYRAYQEYIISNGEALYLKHSEKEKLSNACRIASVLYEVLRKMTTSPNPQALDDIDSTREKSKFYVTYNILPLYSEGVEQAIMQLPEVKAAIAAVRNTRGLPSAEEFGKSQPFVDLFEFLQYCFGFQEGNVANQREHLILLLANIHIRQSHKMSSITKLGDGALDELMKKFFKNYTNWCKFMGRKNSIRLPYVQQEAQQYKLLYTGLYLLIWGEAANLRFMPECLCYIFHHMAYELHGILTGAVNVETGEKLRPAYMDGYESFLNKVVSPIYWVIDKEAKKNKGGTADHSTWRNYDDLNEFFWSSNCFQIGWPMRSDHDFFCLETMKDEVEKRKASRDAVKGKIGSETKDEEQKQPIVEKLCESKWLGKTNFVETRSFWQIFRSFDRMWSFLVMSLQALIIMACYDLGSPLEVFDSEVFEDVMSIFITSATLNLIRAMLDIAFTWKARNTMESSRRKKYVVKLVVAVIWTIVLPVCYASSRRKYTCYTKYKSSVGELCLSVYMIVVTLYLMTNAVELVLFFVPAVRKYIEVSNCRIFTALSWWTQPRLYIGRGMQETQVSQFKYTLFWILVLLSKILFSYFFEIKPLIMPTRQIMKMGVHKYEWHELFPQVKINGGAIVAIWAPIIVVYFMDTQIWYSVFCTIFGGVYGVLHHLGEIRTLGMLRSRFHSLPSAFYASLIPPVPKRDQSETRKGFYLRKSREASEAEKVGIAKFVIVWNQIVNTMRSEDYINNRELDLMKIPVSSELLSGMVRWPIFLLANKFSTAVSIAREFVGKDEILYKKIQKDKYMHCAVTECYESVKCILDNLVVGELERRVISSIVDEIEESIKRSSLLDDFNLSELPTLQAKFIELAELLVWGSESHLDKVVANESHQDKVTPNEGHHDKAIGNGSRHDKVVKNLQDIFELVTNDIMTNGSRVLDYLNSSQQADVDLPFFFRRIEPQLFESTADKSVIHFPLPDNRALHEQVKRFLLLLSIKDKALDIPANLEARRRISFFATSLFMDMPSAPKVRNMMSFSVITPHYLEDVNFSMKELRSKEDVSIIFYMLKIYPDEWKNFLERKGLENQDMEGMTLEELYALESEVKEEIRRWASFRGQTLSRSVRGMMYYREALKLQAFLDMAEDEEILEGYEAAERNNRSMFAQLDALSDMKFTYVVSCQMYGSQKASGDPHAQDILDLMIRYPSLRVAYVEEKEEIVANERPRKIYSSILVKAVNNYDQEVYRIKLPGSPNIGEGKPENQNHAIVFTRGEALQTIDTNQDNHLEEAFKMRNLLQEFFQNHGRQPPTILGLREHIFTGSVSSLAWFMSYQETSFATIGQRILANPLRVRFHYGHPDVFDRIFHITRGGISKSSKTINLSDDVFAGFNSTLRRGCITYHEYLQVGKGRDVGLNQISKFEAKVATGNSEQTLSRDIHRLARRFDFFRMLSCYFTTIGFYFSSLITVLGIYVFLYGQLYLVLSGLQRALMINTKMRNIESLETALASQSFIQLGLLTGLPMVMEIGLEKGFLTSLKDFVLMQLQLAAVFFTFSLGTKTHFYGRTLLHGGAKYKPTGRKVAVFHASFTENYRQYSRSHFVKGFELLLLLIVYDLFRRSYESNMAYILITYSIWFMSITWLFAPFLFNPSSFSWGRIVDDWKFWNKWINQQGGIGIRQDKSWQSWWNDEQDPLRCSGLAARLFEILLSLRFFMYQYGLVYHLDITQQSKNFLVYVLSWAVIVAVFIIVKAVNMGRKRFSASYHFLFRLFKALLFLCILSSIIALSIACKLSFKDLIVCCLAFLPTGWGLILIGQAVRPKIENTGLWHFTEVLAKAYDYGMGVVLFAPIAILAWLPIIHTFHTRFLFNEAFNRHLHIQPILAGRKKNK